MSRMMEGASTEDYKLSIGQDDTNDMFSDNVVTRLAYQWQDKPHRHVYDLCGEVDALKAQIGNYILEIKKLKRKLRQNKDK